MRSTAVFAKRIFASAYAFDNIFQALQDVHTFAPLQTQHFSKKSVLKSTMFVKCQQFFTIFAKSGVAHDAAFYILYRFRCLCDLVDL